MISPAKFGRIGSAYFWEVDPGFGKCVLCAFRDFSSLSVVFGTLKVIEPFPDAGSRA